MKRRNKSAKAQMNNPSDEDEAQRKPLSPTPEQIQVRAYEIFQTRGGAPGRELEDWLLAEMELKAEMGLREGSLAESGTPPSIRSEI